MKSYVVAFYSHFSESDVEIKIVRADSIREAVQEAGYGDRIGDNQTLKEIQQEVFNQDATINVKELECESSA